MVFWKKHITAVRSKYTNIDAKFINKMMLPIGNRLPEPRLLPLHYGFPSKRIWVLFRVDSIHVDFGQIFNNALCFSLYWAYWPFVFFVFLTELTTD